MDSASAQGNRRDHIRTGPLTRRSGNNEAIGAIAVADFPTAAIAGVKAVQLRVRAALSGAAGSIADRERETSVVGSQQEALCARDLDCGGTGSGEPVGLTVAASAGATVVASGDVVGLPALGEEGRGG